MIEVGAEDVRRLNWFGLKPAVARLLASRPVNPVVQLAARKLLPKRIGRRLPLARDYVDYQMASGAKIRLVDPLHDTIARDIYWGGSQPTGAAERHKLRCLERLCARADTLLDIGAYGAFYALIAARSNPQLHAVAYEIVPQNYFHAVRNVLENDLLDRIEVRLCGIGSEPGTIRLPISIGKTSFLSSISLGSKFDTGVSIPVRTLDTETEAMTGPFVVKIDVEGFEEQVFEGGQNFIERARPDIICEILPDADAASAMIDRLLRPLGYRTFTFEDSGLVEHDRIAPRAELRDWLFTASNEAEALLVAG